MKNVMVAYYSRTGMTKTMAEGIAEGVNRQSADTMQR